VFNIKKTIYLSLEGGISDCMEVDLNLNDLNLFLDVHSVDTVEEWGL
jgi:hypothetical protein